MRYAGVFLAVALFVAGHTGFANPQRATCLPEQGPPEPLATRSLPAALPAHIRQQLLANPLRPPPPLHLRERIPTSLSHVTADEPPHATTPVSLHTILSTAAAPFMIDSAIVFSSTDTTRHIYTFTTTAAMASDLTQRLTSGQWVTTRRERYAYDADNRMISALQDYPSGDTLATLSRWTYTYSTSGDLVSATSEDRDLAHNTWSLFYKYTFAYDRLGNILLDQKETINNGQTVSGTRKVSQTDAAGNALVQLDGTWQNGWVDENRLTSTWDAQGQLLTELDDRWEDGQWVHVDRSTFTYDKTGKYLTLEVDDWVNDRWQPVNGHVRTIDSLGNITRWLFQRGKGGQLINGSLLTYTFEGTRTLNALSQIWVDSIWVPNARWAYTYNARGDQTGRIAESWDGNAWTNSLRETVVYDAVGRRILELTEQWQNWEWARAYQDSLAFDAMGNETLHHYMTWIGGVQAYGYRSISLYDQNGAPVSAAYDLWQDGHWTPGYMSWWFADSASVQPRYSFSGTPHNTYTYSGYRIALHTRTISPIDGEPTAFAFTLEQNYPNPFNAGTVITYTLPETRETLLTIYNVLGQEAGRLVDATQGPGTFSVRFDASHLASGVYLSVLKAGDLFQARKMLLLR